MRNLMTWIVTSFLLGGCGFFKKEEQPESEKQAIQVVGEVTSVHAEQGFLLFRRYGPGQLLTGGVLSTRSLDGRRAAHLELSPEKLGRFYAADFAKEENLPRKGDVVVLSKIPNRALNEAFEQAGEDL